MYRLPQRQPPLANKCQLHGQPPTHLCVIATQAVLQEIASYSRSDTERELGGVLLGQAYRHGERLYVEVSAILAADNHDHGPLHFTFAADSWTALQKAQAAHYPQLDMVGWFHTHPDLGAFYSSDDVVVHSAAFTLPWHIGLVLDPVRHEGCFFGWQEGELVALPGFYELLDGQVDSVVDWHVVPTAVYYDLPPLTAPTQAQTSHSYWPSRRLQPTAFDDWPWWVGAGALLLLLLLLLLWVGSLNRQLDQLQQVTIALANETLQERNVAACPDAGLRLFVPVVNGRLATGPISIIGTANFPAAHTYRLEGRLHGSTEWQLLNQWRRDIPLGELGQWDTTGYPASRYEVRLIAVDTNNIRLAHSPLCQILFELE